MIRIFIRHKFTILLGAVVLNVMAAPFMSEAMSLKLFMNLTFTAVMFAAVFSVSRGKKAPLAVSILLMLPCLFFIWWTYFYTGHKNLLLAASVVQALFLVYIGALIFASVFQAPVVTGDVISAALVVYLFIALFFANLYLILELVYPGSFTVPHGTILEQPGILRYFSMVTISTLGYGDIAPASVQARSMASSEAIMGQIYLAVLIARLVSMYGNEQRMGKNKNDA